MRTRKWYGHVLDHDGPTGVVQTDTPTRQFPVLRLPEAILCRAHEEYANQHPGQTYERIQERGGFGLTEVIGLLADALDITTEDENLEET